MGSIPTIPAIYGESGEGVNTPDCGSGMRGFESHLSPFNLLGYSQAVRQRTLTPSCAGSNPATPIFEDLILLWRYSQVVRQRSAKPLSPVQIRLPPLVPKGANCKYAGVAELADALDSKSSVR